MSFSIRSLNIDEFHMNLIPNAETELQIVGGPILKQEQKLCEININRISCCSSNSYQHIISNVSGA